MRKKEILVSVIIPVYNASEYIERCVKSVCSQSYENIEILLMVGRCTDDSVLKCISLQKEDARIVVVSRKDNGLGDARNYALKIAKGKYLAYVDADDYVEKTFIEKLLLPLENDPMADISCCGYKCFVDGREEYSEGWIPGRSGSVNMDFEAYVKNVSCGAVWLKMYRRDWVLEHEICMFDKCHEDDALHFVLAATVGRMCFVQEELYYYNTGNLDSLWKSDKHRKDFESAMCFSLDYIRKHHLFEQNYIAIRKYVMNHCKTFFLKHGGSDSRLLEYFPEIKEEESIIKEKNITDNIFVFGAGADCHIFLQKCDKGRMKYIVDNNPSLKGNFLDGIEIINFDGFKKLYSAELIVITSSNYYYELAKQIRQSGIFNYMTASEYLSLQKVKDEDLSNE